MVVKGDVAGFNVEKECPKFMLNGPCGGMSNGMCEVSGPCVWVRIYAKLKSEGKVSEFQNVRLPRTK